MEGQKKTFLEEFSVSNVEATYIDLLCETKKKLSIVMCY
jgi:hypothetical protein